MLILVAVTVKTAVDSGLFRHAKDAVQKWGDAERDELQLGDNIDEILDQYKPKEHNWQRNEDNIKCDHCGLSFIIGDFVDYTPDPTSKTIKISDEESGKADMNLADLNATNNSTNVAQVFAADDAAGIPISNNTFTQEEGTYWRVMGVEDSDGNGTNETLLIKMATPTEQKLYLYGAAAYNNGPEIINRIAKELYSSSKYGEARSMNINDVNNTLQYTPRGGFYRSGSTTQETNGFNTQLKDLPEWETLKANGTYTPDGTNTPEKLGSYKVAGYIYMVSGSETEPVVQNLATGAKTAITTNTLSTIFMDTSGNTVVYWLACRCVFAGGDFAYFGPGGVAAGIVISCSDYFCSDGAVRGDSIGVCPVVSLKSEIPSKIEVK